MTCCIKTNRSSSVVVFFCVLCITGCIYTNVTVLPSSYFLRMAGRHRD
jgi:hypothetical protein